MKKYGFSIIVFFESECVICILWKSTDAKFRYLGSDCLDLQRHQPLCRSSSRWLCCTRVVLKISAIVSFLLFCGIDDDVDFSHRSERRPILSRRTYQVPSSTQTTGDSLWRNWNLRMEVLTKADLCNWDDFQMDDQIICRSVPLSTCCPSSPGLGESPAFLLLSFSRMDILLN